AGTNSLHTNALDEVLALPSQKAAEIALRTQQVLMEETGVVNVADPLGGSWYVEELTDEMERQAEAIFARIKDMSAATGQGEGSMTSGILRGIEDGWFMAEIADAAFDYQKKVEKGDKKVVGVNVHESSVVDDLEILRISHEVELEQQRTLADRRTKRDDAKVRASLQHMVDVARTSDNMLPAMLDATRNEATLGEICDALRGEWGGYLEPPRF
ncbi:MAG TPA: methylmalonyl-CoA mutase family protein, partial [Mycobacteriales bacterium]|nr:methylmalonyl-CoA mutase family protein [Mycobacteriales bacterium]